MQLDDNYYGDGGGYSFHDRMQANLVSKSEFPLDDQAHQYVKKEKKEKKKKNKDKKKKYRH